MILDLLFFIRTRYCVKYLVFMKLCRSDEGFINYQIKNTFI